MSGPRILVIEDNREIRISAHFVLEDFGFQVATLDNLALTKPWLLQHATDLILLDMNY